MTTYDLDVDGCMESMVDELKQLKPDYTIEPNKKIVIHAKARIVFDFEKKTVHHYLTP